MGQTTVVELKSPQPGPDAPTPAPSAQTDGVPEKFLKDGKPDVQAILKSYKELESKLGKPQASPQAPEGQPQAEPQADPGDKPAVPEAAPEAAKADAFAKYTEEFATKGSLTPESYAELESKGIPKAMVDAYIDGIKATTQKQASEIYGLVGGEDSYQKMIAYAQKALKPDEAKAYDDAVLSGDPAKIKMAVESLKSRWVAAEGKQPNLSFGQGSPTAEVYESKEQWLADLRNPKYEKDPAFRDKVMKKLGRSQI